MAAVKTTYAAKVATTRPETMGVNVRARKAHTSTSSRAVGMKVNTMALNTMATLRVPAHQADVRDKEQYVAGTGRSAQEHQLRDDSAA